ESSSAGNAGTGEPHIGRHAGGDLDSTRPLETRLCRRAAEIGMTLEAELARGLDALHLVIAPEIQHKLLDYLELVQKWNRVYNLTAVRDAEKMLTQHLLDSLAVVPHVARARIVDIGSGAGL